MSATSFVPFYQSQHAACIRKRLVTDGGPCSFVFLNNIGRRDFSNVVYSRRHRRLFSFRYHIIRLVVDEIFTGRLLPFQNFSWGIESDIPLTIHVDTTQISSMYVICTRHLLCPIQSCTYDMHNVAIFRYERSCY